MSEPREPPPARVTVDEIGVGFDDRRRWTGGPPMAPPEQPIGDSPAQNRTWPMRTMMGVQIAVPMRQYSILPLER